MTVTHTKLLLIKNYTINICIMEVGCVTYTKYNDSKMSHASKCNVPNSALNII